MQTNVSIFQDAGELMIGSRLKRLGERIYTQVGQVYRKLGIPFEPAWFPVFFLLDRQETLAVTALARAVGVSDAAASQLIGQLQKRGLVDAAAADRDRRVRTVTLSTMGRELLVRVRPVWSALSHALAEIESGPDELGRMLALIDDLESALNLDELANRMMLQLRDPDRQE